MNLSLAPTPVGWRLHAVMKEDPLLEASFPPPAPRNCRFLMSVSFARDRKAPHVAMLSATSAAKAMPVAPMDLLPLRKRTMAATRFVAVAGRQPVPDETLSPGGHPQLNTGVLAEARWRHGRRSPHILVLAALSGELDVADRAVGSATSARHSLRCGTPRTSLAFRSRHSPPMR